MWQCCYKKNSVINSFMDTQRLTLSKEKSVVVHIGNTKKCTLKCPKLKVHSEPMEEKECTKYLGNFISSKGGVRETIEDRRKKGWERSPPSLASSRRWTWELTDSRLASSSGRASLSIAFCTLQKPCLG